MTTKSAECILVKDIMNRRKNMDKKTLLELKKKAARIRKNILILFTIFILLLFFFKSLYNIFELLQEFFLIY